MIVEIPRRTKRRKVKIIGQNSKIFINSISRNKIMSSKGRDSTSITKNQGGEKSSLKWNEEGKNGQDSFTSKSKCTDIGHKRYRKERKA